jgi:hypothetical protein
MVNYKVPEEIVRRNARPRLPGDDRTIRNETLKREYERFSQSVNISGEIVPIDSDWPISDAAWAKENLARAKQTLPNGYCGLPLQQSCPHPNACLTCNHFLTTPGFLDQHREQLQRTEQLIFQAADGRQRLSEMNEPIRLNLIRVIDSLEALDEPDAA